MALMNLGRGALSAASAGIGVAGENITGANTQGGVRRNAMLEASIVTRGVAGGVFFSGVGRADDGFISRNLVNEVSLLAPADARQSALSFVEPMLAPPDDAGIGDRMNEFFASLEDLALKADDPSARLVVLQNAQAIASGFNDASTGMSTARQQLLLNGQSMASEISDKLEAIATINGKIQGLRGQETSAKAEMIDSRDQLVREVSELIDVNVLPNEDGTVTMLSSGSTLVDRATAATVTVGVDASDNLSVTFTRAGTSHDVSSRVASGKLAGLIEARDQDIPEMMADLDQLATDFATAVNAAHTAGLDLNGNNGEPLFTDGSGNPLPPPPGSAFAISLNPVIAADPDLLAAADAASPPPGGNANALALAQIATSPIGAGGTPTERFANISGKIGSKVTAADAEVTVRTSTVAHANSLRESISGVSLDEKMINLTQFQRAFEASMRVITAANEMLDELVRTL